MTIRQISVFIDDKAGSLAKVLDVLKEGGHQILTSMLADSPEFAIYRVLCTDAEHAFQSLKAAGFNVMQPNVLALAVADEPGSAASAIRILSDAGISIRYMYSFRLAGKGILVVRTDQTERANEVIILNKLQTVSENDLAQMIKA
ncbi:MAG: amino acid-binding protein [Bacteroidales bacterium]|nr:amino acid-binding protein [Bacteroidales bacterium]